MQAAWRRRHLRFLPLALLVVLWLSAAAAQDVASAPHFEAYRPTGPARASLSTAQDVSHRHIDSIFRDQRVKPPPTTAGPRNPPDADDYELSGLVLVTTIADGAVHALRRDNGVRLWTLHDTDPARARTILGPLVTSSSGLRPPSGRRPTNTSDVDVSETTDVPEERYIVEPGTGAIFLHSRSTGILHRLPLSVPDLVQSSPFSFPDGSSSRLFVGSKTTQLVGVDLASGRVVGLFGPEAGWCEWKTQPGMTGASTECDEAIDQRPHDLLYMGRTEYHLSVYEKVNGDLVQNLVFTTYHPSALTSRTPPWPGSPDDRYIQSLHSGELVCLRSTGIGWDWHSRELQSPAAEIFDVALPTSSESAQPVLFRHPIPRPLDDLVESLGLPDVTFVGRTEPDGVLFAMSRHQYPFIAASGGGFGAAPASESEDGLLGLHRVEGPGPRPRPGDRGSQLVIDAPTDDSRRPLPQISAAPNRLTLPPGASSPSSDHLAVRIALSIVLCAIAAVFWSKWRYTTAIGRNDKTSAPANGSSETSEEAHEAITPPPAELSRGLDTAATFDKDLPPLPLLIANNGQADISKESVDASDDESSEGESKESAPKRKKRRGKRGKRPGQRLAIAATDTSSQSTDIVSKPQVIVMGEDLEVAAKDGEVRVGSLVVSDQILGIGSHGTVVLRGEFQGRAVAVKRMLKQLITIATHEVALLQETDEHANVIRYFCKEQRENFLYIALELCPRSLADLIERPASCEPELVEALNPKQALRQITSGLAHLHRLKIVHRDIKPPNILVAHRRASDGGLRMLISDFGLCKRLDGDASSFHQSMTYDAAGSVGWRAPEVLRGDVDPNEDQESSGLTPSASVPGVVGEDGRITHKRLTRAIDIFSLGCLAYYLLSGGDHPFGSRYERESNILKGCYTLNKLDNMGEEAIEAQEMVESMLCATSSDRPSAQMLLSHPFFWSPTRRLHFICDASDRFETMEREPPDPVLVAVEQDAVSVVGADWLKALDRALIDNLGKYRKYDGGSVRDLLRVIRNKKNHFQDLPDTVKRSLGTPPEGFLGYFTQRFPRLFLHVWNVARRELPDDQLFATYFCTPSDV